MRALGFVALATLLAGAAAQDSPDPIVLAQLGSFTEAPVFDDAGNLFVSHGGAVSKIAPDGTVSQWVQAEHANGHKILPSGEHLLCAGPVVLRLNANGQVLGEAASDCGGHPIRLTNDLTLDRRGGFYFTDPGDFSAGALEDELGKVCYVDADGVSHLVADGLGFPNGVVLRADGTTLLIGEMMRNRILALPLTSPGKAGAPSVFADLPPGEGTLITPDGMALDEDGNLYAAHFGTGYIRVFDPEGTLVRSLPAGMGSPSNLVFGGEDRDQLFITGSEALGDNLPGVVHRLSLPGVRGLPTR